ncbi:phosphohydrolase [Acidovorax sp. SUPP950]|uniref:HD-GYP domain-containing protein n=1 Tax=unclassified Acidovorax TaxID=2684926 RepID=UPI0023D487E1|nr:MULTISPECIES: phosphohydrolase [Comamonadaceae]WOI47960.1 phosphohydrolase [Paracidovorax avenae]GKS76477.1 phosphohydrolase [Acidovorax sp. SUPP950]
MNLVALNIESIQLGSPLPFILRGADGVLLAQKGYVIRTRNELDVLLSRGLQLCVDTDESGDSHRAYLAQLQQMLMSDTSLGQIASMKISAGAQASRDRVEGGPPDWPGLQLRATQLLRAPQAHDFPDRFDALHRELALHCRQSPDAVLLALIYLSGHETRQYSGTHAMLVACVCMLVAVEQLRWPVERVMQTGRAALSMNIAMTALQDQLAVQAQPLTSEQIAAVESHATRSETLLRHLGVHDPVWLEAVRCHHHRSPGPLADKSEGQQIARLIQRADVFGARLAPRASRAPMPVTAAMQASYYDESHQVDEAGSALVKTLGVYPPGAFVRLVSQEIAVTLRRGGSATTPRVAVVLNRNGMPTGELIPRDTAQPAWKVTGAIAQRDVRVQLQLNRLLSLV